MIKRKSQQLIVWSALTLLAIAGAMRTIAAKPAGPTTNAESADRFVNSICVATHWGYPDTPYGQRYGEVKQKLIESGIRNVRDGLFADHAQDLGKNGIRMTAIVDVPNHANGNEQTIQRIVNQIQGANAAGAKIDAIEGPNEADLFWDASRFNKKYKGQSFPQGLIAFQKDLYTAVKRNPATRNIKVIGPSLGGTYDPGAGKPNPLGTGGLNGAVDWGNFHPYPGSNPFNLPFDYNTTQKYYWNSNFPSISIDEHPYLFELAHAPFKPKPMVATETGYSTFNNGVSETVHAKYMPRLFLEFFRKGIPRTCSYEFVDEFADPGKSNREANFGLLRRDLTAKPAYTALKNLIQLLKDPGASFTPEKLNYELIVRPVQNYREPKSGRIANYDRTHYVHHLLLQKRDRTFYLALWHEISSYDTSTNPPREIEPPNMPATLKLNQPIRSATIYTLGIDGSLKATSARLNNGQLDLSVPDRVMLVKLMPGN